MPWRKGTDWVCPHNNTRTYNFFFFVDLIFLYLSPKSLLPLSCQQPFQQTHYQLCKPCLPSFSLKPCSWLASWCCRVQARVLVPVRRSLAFYWDWPMVAWTRGYNRNFRLDNTTHLLGNGFIVDMHHFVLSYLSRGGNNSRRKARLATLKNILASGEKNRKQKENPIQKISTSKL